MNIQKMSASAFSQLHLVVLTDAFHRYLTSETKPEHVLLLSQVSDSADLPQVLCIGLVTAPVMATSTNLKAFSVPCPKSMLASLNCLPDSCSKGPRVLCTQLTYVLGEDMVASF